MRLILRVLVLFVVTAGCGGGSDGTRSAARSSSVEEAASSSLPVTAGSGASHLAAITPSATSIQEGLLAASDLGPDYAEVNGQLGFMPETARPTLCGQPNVNSQVAPTVDIGFFASGGPIAWVEEEVLVYADATTATDAFDKIKAGSDCTQGAVRSFGPSTALAEGCAEFTRQDSCTFTPAPLQDLSAEFGADAAFRTASFEDKSFYGQLFAIRDDASIVMFQFASSSPLPDVMAIVEQGLEKLTN